MIKRICDACGKEEEVYKPGYPIYGDGSREYCEYCLKKWREIEDKALQAADEAGNAAYEKVIQEWRTLIQEEVKQ